MATRVLAKTLPELEAAIAAHCASGRVFVLFSGDGSPSWCPDCNDAHPVIEAAFAGASAATVLIEVPLPRAEYSTSANPANAGHWARVHAVAQLKKIPTLMRFSKDGRKKLGECVEGDAANAELVEALLE